MAKKKVIKKVAKKTSAKGGSKKKSTAKASQKANAKKGAKKAVKKKIASKPPAKKTVKKSDTKRGVQKQSTPKKIAKKKTNKAVPSRASVKKVVAKKAAKKTATKKPSVKTAAKPFAKRLVKKPVKKQSFKQQVTSAVKDAIEAVVDKIKSAIGTDENTSQENQNNKKSVPVAQGTSEVKKFAAHSTRLREGMEAPEFEGRDQNGNLVRSADFRGKTLILYFYPKDDTPGCTAESCSLRDEYQYLNNNNYAVVGVSADDETSHKKFSEKYDLPFPLIADTDKKIIGDYDVFGEKQLAGTIYDGIIRTTFVIDSEGIIKNIITKVDTEHHAKQILDLG